MTAPREMTIRKNYKLIVILSTHTIPFVVVELDGVNRLSSDSKYSPEPTWEPSFVVF